jgi:hypothetical protein
MATDKYTAVWVSHSSMSDFIKCPRSYFLRHLYKNPDTGRKVQLVIPQMSLGTAVHEVLEVISNLPTEKRFQTPLMDLYDTAWKKVSGKKGGFVSSESEALYRERGRAMIERIVKNPGPLKNKAVKIHMEVPNYWLSEEDNIILCGKLDWLEYLSETDSVHIIDFKTSKVEENKESFQLPIYYLLTTKLQKRPVTKASYWYVERNDTLTPVDLPEIADCEEQILKIARQMKVARQLERFKCESGGCFACKAYEAIVDGKAECVGVDERNKDLYMWEESTDEDLSEIL